MSNLHDALLRQRAQSFDEGAGLRGAAFYGVTLGRVVSTDDPQQMGRLFVLCPDLGDPPDLDPSDFTNLPPCTYLAPFGGITESDQSRGPDDTYSQGPVTYGMWAIPKRGAIVGVMCINGNPAQRVWVGTVYEQYVVNTLPHGRYFYEDQDGTIPHPKGAPYGPVTATENPIQPLFDNQTSAFKTRLGNFEWRTRGADFQNTAVIGDANYQPSPCYVEDDSDVDFTQEDGTTIHIVEGMAQGRDNEGANDNQTYSWTTPGFHSISLDDRKINCRIKFRTSAGHQIIMDDTNERIYINTAKGNNWIEIDEDGCIDIYSSEKISATAKHINLTAEETIRLYGKTGVHIKSDADIRIQAETKIETTAGSDIDTKAGGHLYETVIGDHHTKVTGNLHQQSSGNIEIKATGNIHETASGNHETNASGTISEQSGGANNTLAGGNIVETGAQIHMNGPGAASAASAADAIEAAPDPAFFTNRYPLHEPWARTGTKADNTHEPKYLYNDPNVGREHKTRGPNWRR